MDAATIQGKIYRGYAQAAQRIGYPYNVYRPSYASVNALDSSNISTQDLLVSLNQKGDYLKPNEYGQAVWWSYHDASLTQVGDYLSGKMGNFFIAAQQDLLPVMCVSCNRVASIARPNVAGTKGNVGYSSAIPSSSIAELADWPASILLMADVKNPNVLPLDTKQPTWRVLLPSTCNITLRTSDIVSDDLGRKYAIQTAELTDLGWRMTAIQLQA